MVDDLPWLPGFSETRGKLQRSGTIRHRADPNAIQLPATARRRNEGGEPSLAQFRDETLGIGTIREAADLDGKTGFHPDKTSIPRLRAEDDADARAWLLDGIDLPDRQGE